jgi:acetyl-CoA carboxylase carboxyl transferase subunit beta
MKQPFMTRREKLINLMLLRKKAAAPVKKPLGGDLAKKCPGCGKEYGAKELSENLFVCPGCDFHFKIPAYERIKILLDRNSFKESDKKMASLNPIGFPGYEEKMSESRKSAGVRESVVTGTGKIDGIKVVLAVLESGFLMGSLGTAAGEKITRAIEFAARKGLPLIIISSSGGARMQEGIFSLMQMAKTSAALSKLSDAKCLYISVLTDPTMGGVTASFASLGDVIIAEPNALIGFAGPRVIEQTIRQKLPEGFQRSEFMLTHGFLDAVVRRGDMRASISLLLKLHRREAGLYNVSGLRKQD